MTDPLEEIRKDAEDAAVRGRCFQMTSARAAQLALLIGKLQNEQAPKVPAELNQLIIDTVAFIQSEFACAATAALDGDPLERGKCREIRDRLCEWL